jgi:hypothetical protein
MRHAPKITFYTLFLSHSSDLDPSKPRIGNIPARLARIDPILALGSLGSTRSLDDSK